MSIKDKLQALLNESETIQLIEGEDTHTVEQLDESLIFASGHVEDDLDNYNNELKQHGIKLHSKDAGDTSIISVRKNNKSIGVFPHDYKDTAEDFANELHSITKNHGVHVKSRAIDGGDVVRISKPTDKLQKESTDMNESNKIQHTYNIHPQYRDSDNKREFKKSARDAGITVRNHPTGEVQNHADENLLLSHHDKNHLEKWIDDNYAPVEGSHDLGYGPSHTYIPPKSMKESMDEDMDALFNGESLTEEFKEKATTIFEAAVISRVKDEVQELDEIYSTQVQALKEQSEETIETLKEEFAQKLDEQVEEVKSSLVEHVDGFLNYIVEQWMNDNEVALETGIKNEIAENVVTGLHKLFSENFVQVPEDKTDLVSEMELHLETVIDKLDEQIKANIELTKTINESKRETMIEKFSQGLTDLNAEKFKSLVEELSFDSAEKFQVKLETIKENYFTKKTLKESTKTNIMITDEPVLELNEAVIPKQTPVMSAYLKQFSK